MYLYQVVLICLQLTISVGVKGCALTGISNPSNGGRVFVYLSGVQMLIVETVAPEVCEKGPSTKHTQHSKDT